MGSNTENTQYPTQVKAVPSELWRSAVIENQICAYNGIMSGEIISSVLQLVDSYLRQSNAIPRRKKNTINVLIECLQNMYYHHGSLIIDDLNIAGCYIAAHRVENDILIHCSNLISESQISIIQAQIESLNSMNNEQVHQYYLDVLDKGMLSPVGGAGLGLIRMLRESRSPLTYSFTQAQNNIWFFNLSLRILQVFPHTSAENRNLS